MASPLSRASGALARLTPAALAVLSDDELLARQRELVAQRRLLDAGLASIAGEIARRSDRTLGYAGLSARHGVRTPEELVARETGLSAREAGALVRIGSIAGDEGVGAVVSTAIDAGSLSVAAADEIVRGLGAPSDVLPARELERAATELLATTPGQTPECLGQAARDLRAELDAATVRDRERELRSRRSLRMFAQSDGMTRLTALLDPESASQVRAVFDAITSPRRGGPRFVGKDERARADRIARDPRSTEQLALDGFVELLRIGAAVEPGEIVGSTRPSVRIHVTDADLRRRGIDPATGEPYAADPTTGQQYPVDAVSGRRAAAGMATIEGQAALVSTATAERAICATGAVPIHFDFRDQVINVGRDQRLFTTRQRLGLAARDGGCLWPGCDRPPSWCEAHHIDEWRAHGGRTDLADGVLLCRFHHLAVHDNGWRITHAPPEDSVLVATSRSSQNAADSRSSNAAAGPARNAAAGPPHSAAGRLAGTAPASVGLAGAAPGAVEPAGPAGTIPAGAAGSTSGAGSMARALPPLYQAIPPATIDPARAPVPLPSKRRLHGRL